MPDDAGVAVRALYAKIQQPNVALVTYAEHLEASARQLAEVFAMPNSDGPEWQLRCLLSASYGVIAYLLDALIECDQGTSADAAWEVRDMCDAGQPLAEWVSERLTRLGVDVDALASRTEGDVR